MDHTHRIQTAVATRRMGATGTPCGPSIRPRTIRKRWWLATGLLVFALVATGCTGTSQRSPTPTVAPTATPAPLAPLALTIAVRQAGASCPRDAAWSPDGTQLAVLVTRDECQVRPATKGPDLVLVYDVASGQVRAQFDLAPLLTPAHAAIDFDEDIFGESPMSWSPDGTTLAIPVVLWSVVSGGADRAGLLLVPVAGGAATLIAGPRTWVDSPDGIHSYVTSAPIWEVAAKAAGDQVALPLPPSPTYGWTSPTTLAPSTSAAAFSTWQPGVLAAIPVNGEHAGFPVWEYYSSTATEWSADGAAIASDVVTQYLVDATKQAPAQVNGKMCLEERLPLPCATTTLPAPDAAFAEVAARVKAAAESSDPPYPNRVPLAYRPDGGMLAAVLPGDALTAGDQFTPPNRTLRISLLETATGRTHAIAQFAPQGPGDTGAVGRPFFYWSPAGQQLAVINANDDTVLVFDIP